MATAGARFGYAVDVSGDLVFVGSPADASPGGAMYAYKVRQRVLLGRDERGDNGRTGGRSLVVICEL